MLSYWSYRPALIGIITFSPLVESKQLHRLFITILISFFFQISFSIIVAPIRTGIKVIESC